MYYYYSNFFLFYTKGLGNTIAELNIDEYLQHADSLPVVQKTKFSMVVPEVDEKLTMSHRKTIILFGIEVRFPLNYI